MTDLSKQLADLELKLSTIKQEIADQANKVPVESKAEQEQKFVTEFRETIVKNDLYYDREFQDIIAIPNAIYYKGIRRSSLNFIENSFRIDKASAHRETINICKKYPNVNIVIIPGASKAEKYEDGVQSYRIEAIAMTHGQFIELEEAKFAAALGFTFGINDANDKHSIMRLYKDTPNIYTSNPTEWRKITAAKVLIDLAKS